MLTTKRLSAALATAMCCASTPSLAQNQQQPSAENMANARALGVEGVELADRGDCTTAIDRLWRAESLYHAPTILGRLGECQVNLGKIVAGTETLQRVVREPMGPGSPPAFLAARDRAQKVLEASLPKIGKLRIHVDNAQAPGLVVTVDGEAVPLAALDVDRLTDPGSHQVQASAPGFATQTSTVSLAEGGSAQVTLSLEPVPGATAAPPATAPPAAPVAVPPPAPLAVETAPPGKDEGGGSSKVGPIVLLAAGGAGIIVGSIFGGLALGKKSSLDGVCHPKSDCPASSQSDIDALRTNATIATVGFAVGGAAAAAGGVWLLVGGKSKPSTTASAGRVVVHPWVGPASAGVSGAF
ncbi:MAG TPA: hypothetical protein VHC69_19445 [Polyangiaceae bacterium]|nr:hypothetical protein [Polyangiaceae bacterium]